MFFPCDSEPEASRAGRSAAVVFGGEDARHKDGDWTHSTGITGVMDLPPMQAACRAISDHGILMLVQTTVNAASTLRVIGIGNEDI